MNDPDTEPDQPGLFDALDRPALPRPPTPGPTFTRFRPKPYRLCDDCVRDIHDHGQTDAAPAKLVSWRHVDGADVLLLCERHHQARKGVLPAGTERP